LIIINLKFWHAVGIVLCKQTNNLTQTNLKQTKTNSNEKHCKSTRSSINAALPFFDVELIAPRPVHGISNPATIGEHIYNKQLALRISQVEMARRIGVAPERLTDWCFRGKQPHVTYGPRIIEALGYNPFPIDTGTLYGRIAKYRIEHGLTAEAFAKRAGVNRNCLCLLAKGDAGITTQQRQKIEKLLNQKELST